MNADQKKLISWYNQNHRKLPWRSTTDPYKIWISEIMLQQTRVEAVKSYYINFLKHFPTVKKLAQAKEEAVLKQWTGLGYYSRAKNIHKAAKLFALHSFPKSWKELIKYPGLGDYSARAISSFAFNENVGVLDGNVIRLLSRKYNLAVQWWKTSDKKLLQEKADEMVKTTDAQLTNQALIELGATLCASKNPQCILCPWNKSCLALKNNRQHQLPLKRIKKKKEIWYWEMQIITDKHKIALIKNPMIPFLKDYLVFPGKAKKLDSKPQDFDFKHTITHHEIYVKIKYKKISSINNQKKYFGNYGVNKLKDIFWSKKEEIKNISPSSVNIKAVKFL